VKPTRKRHFCQRTSCPSTWKLGPSGWVISIGFCVVRTGPVTAGSWKLPDSSGTGTGPRSMTWSTVLSMTST
jgi:hypothetical protein